MLCVEALHYIMFFKGQLNGLKDTLKIKSHFRRIFFFPLYNWLFVNSSVSHYEPGFVLLSWCLEKFLLTLLMFLHCDCVECMVPSQYLTCMYTSLCITHVYQTCKVTAGHTSGTWWDDSPDSDMNTTQYMNITAVWENWCWRFTSVSSLLAATCLPVNSLMWG